MIVSRISRWPLFICFLTVIGCGGESNSGGDISDTYLEFCKSTTAAEEVPAVACRVIPELIDKFVTDENQRRGAYIVAIANNFYQTNDAGRAATWRVLVDQFGVDEAYFDPETHSMRGNLNEVIEAMYVSAGVDYGGDRRAFRQDIEAKMASPEAQVYMEERATYYSQQMPE
jgi:hypothetical protein